MFLSKVFFPTASTWNLSGLACILFTLNQLIRTFDSGFDCLPHDILLDKLSAYGMSNDSVSLLESYLSNRKQQIKINSILSSWADIKKKMYPKGQSWF
jgi:hypothetical protein